MKLNVMKFLVTVMFVCLCLITNELKSQDKRGCDELNTHVIIENDPPATTIIILKDQLPQDTVVISMDHAVDPFEQGLILVDINFDGFCDLVVADMLSASHGLLDTYYFTYDSIQNRYIEQFLLPKANGGIQVNSTKKEITVLCSYGDCEAVYHFVNGKYQLVAGEFRIDP